MLRRKPEGKGAVLIEGPKRCGKPATAGKTAAAILCMDEPRRRAENVMLSGSDPQRLLRGETPRLIDEWQPAPKLWDAVRVETACRGSTGRFILTGSAVPPETDEITHSGAGRFSPLCMRTMSLYESGDSTGDVTMSELFSGPESIDGTGDADTERPAFLICRGGWPQAVGMRPEIALDQAFGYCEAIVRSDLSRADGVRKSPDRVRKLMRSYARVQGAQAAYKAVGEDMGGNDGHPVSAETAAMYIGALKRIFVAEDMPAWNPNLRSKAAIRSPGRAIIPIPPSRRRLLAPAQAAFCPT